VSTRAAKRSWARQPLDRLPELAATDKLNELMGYFFRTGLCALACLGACSPSSEPGRSGVTGAGGSGTPDPEGCEPDCLWEDDMHPIPLSHFLSDWESGCQTEVLPYGLRVLEPQAGNGEGGGAGSSGVRVCEDACSPAIAEGRHYVDVKRIFEPIAIVTEFRADKSATSGTLTLELHADANDADECAPPLATATIPFEASPRVGRGYCTEFSRAEGASALVPPLWLTARISDASAASGLRIELWEWFDDGCPPPFRPVGPTPP